MSWWSKHVNQALLCDYHDYWAVSRELCVNPNDVHMSAGCLHLMMTYAVKSRIMNQSKFVYDVSNAPPQS